MRVDVHPTSRLRGAKPIDLAGHLGTAMRALAEDSVDMSRLRLVCDWIQYRDNFRDVVDARPILATSAGRLADSVELAIDLRRCPDVDLAKLVHQALAEYNRPAGHGLGTQRLPLQDWVPGRESLIWQFNSLYWQYLSHWERVTGREYEQALPGGESDARNREATGALILELFRVWDDLDSRAALPDELYVVELGVGNGHQAKTWLDLFVELDRAHGREYYRRLHYLMGDYSPEVLARARRTVSAHRDRISSVVVDATEPLTSLGFLRYKAFLVYISNVYDNLPTDELARIDGHVYQVETRAYLPSASATDLATRLAIDAAEVPGLIGKVPELVGKLLKLGPELLVEAMPDRFPDIGTAVEFWRAAWLALRLAERYVPVPGLDLYEITPSLTGEALRPLLDAGGDVRMHVSNGAAASFADTLPLLHPFGRLQCHDLFVTGLHQYQDGFRGPGKYDGSVVNWVNGPLLAHVGGKRGFDVGYAPFQQRKGSNITTLTVQVRD